MREPKVEEDEKAFRKGAPGTRRRTVGLHEDRKGPQTLLKSLGRVIIVVVLSLLVTDALKLKTTDFLYVQTDWLQSDPPVRRSGSPRQAWTTCRNRHASEQGGLGASASGTKEKKGALPHLYCVIVPAVALILTAFLIPSSVDPEIEAGGSFPLPFNRVRDDGARMKIRPAAVETSDTILLFRLNGDLLSDHCGETQSDSAVPIDHCLIRSQARSHRSRSPANEPKLCPTGGES